MLRGLRYLVTCSSPRAGSSQFLKTSTKLDIFSYNQLLTIFSILHLKKKLFELRNSFFREEYSGFHPFTKGNKDLNSIVWTSTGSGPKTIITSTPFDLDSIDPLPIDRLRKNNTITIPFASQRLPYHFFAHKSFSYHIGSVWSSGTTRTIARNDGIPKVETITRSQDSIEVTNDTGIDFDEDDIVTVYWDKDVMKWRTSVAAHQTEYTG